MSPIYVPGKVVLAKQFTWNETVWNPSMIQTALWLDAADASSITLASGAVSQWNDKSGNARHATQSTTNSRPSYSSTGFNSLPGVTFDGVDDNMLHGCTQSGQYTLIAVYKVNSAQTGFRGVFNVGPANNSGGTMLVARTTSSFVGSFGGVELNSTAAYANGQSLIAIIEDDNGSAIKSFWINGAQSGTFTNNPEGQSGTVGGILSQYAAITMAECLAIPSVASTSTRQRIEGYLAHKWGLTANLPGDHPYKTVGPTP
jgi:hypothetical protein